MQSFVVGLLNSNMVMQAQMMLNASGAQMRRLYWKTYHKDHTHHILHENLGVQKPCLKWAQFLFTVDQTQAVDDSEQRSCLSKI